MARNFNWIKAPWDCWSDTLSLDLINYTNPEVNPFLDIGNQYEEAEEFLKKVKNEWYIYGSSGHGRFARAFPVAGVRGGYDNEPLLSPLYKQSRYLKHKQYELKDHLGNVRVVVSDLKKSTTSGDSVPPFRSEVLAAYNYYPFGMLQPGMYKEGDTTYRFGFNGMLRDDDMMNKLSTVPDEGRGNSYDFGARMYNPRVTRFFSLDPLKSKFTSFAPYTYVLDNPILFVDLNGEDVFVAFSGYNHPWENDAATAGQIVNEIRDFAKKNNIKDFDAKSFVTGLFSSQAKDAMKFIKDNLSKDEKLYIYGYSLGGHEAMNKLLPMLAKEGIKAELLITVDASKGGLGNINNIVNENAIENVNFYQLTPDKAGSKGQPNQREDGSWDGILNIKVSGTDHQQIDEDTKKWVIPMLQESIMKNNENTIKDKKEDD